MANFAPKIPPMPLLTAIGRATDHIIDPFSTNRQIEPKLVDKLISLACAPAFKKSYPKMLIKAITKKLPAPGPINPS